MEARILLDHPEEEGVAEDATDNHDQVQDDVAPVGKVRIVDGAVAATVVRVIVAASHGAVSRIRTIRRESKKFPCHKGSLEKDSF